MEIPDETDDATSTTVSFKDAKLGDETYTYELPDGEEIWGEYSFVTELNEWFDERDVEMKLIRKRWALVAVDEITLPDPYPDEDEDEDDNDDEPDVESVTEQPGAVQRSEP